MRTTTRTQTALHLPLGWLGVVVCAGLSACSLRPVLDAPDGAPRHVIDAADIPDATPRAEPLSRYGNPASYVVNGTRYHVRDSSEGYVARGIASWYGTKFHGQRTSSGEPYNMYAMTAAHRTLPLPTYARVTNLSNGRSVVVKINDRGPFVKNRLIDLSYAAAMKLGVVASGTAPVEVRAIDVNRKPEPEEPHLTKAALSAGETAHDQLYVQVGAFAERGNAERLRDQLSQLTSVGPVEIQQGVNGNGRILYRVRIGPLPSVPEADRLSGVLARAGIRNSKIVVD